MVEAHLVAGLCSHFWDGKHVTRNQRLLVTPNNQRIKLGDGLNHLAWGSFQSSRNHYSSFPTIFFRGHISFWRSIPKKRWQQFPWFQGFCRVAYSAVIKRIFLATGRIVNPETFGMHNARDY